GTGGLIMNKRIDRACKCGGHGQVFMQTAERTSLGHRLLGGRYPSLADYVRTGGGGPPPQRAHVDHLFPSENPVTTWLSASGGGGERAGVCGREGDAEKQTFRQPGLCRA